MNGWMGGWNPFYARGKVCSFEVTVATRLQLINDDFAELLFVIGYYS